MKSVFKKYVLILIGVCVSHCLLSQNASVFVGDVGVYFNGISCFEGDFVDESQQGVLLDGELCFLNEVDNDVVLKSNVNYEGVLNFKGAANTYLNSNEALVNNLLVDISNGDLFLNGLLNVRDVLTLFQGRVLPDADGLVVLKNSSESALVFDNAQTNKSYLGLPLKRSVVPGQDYYFPIGTSDSYHPIKLSDCSNSNEITISYSKDLDEEWRTIAGIEKIEFPTSGAWNITDNGFDVSFLPVVSKLNNNGELLDVKVDGLYVKEPYSSTGETVFHRSMESVDDFYLKADGSIGKGMYAIVETDYGLNDGGDEIELVNTLVVDQSSNSYFVVPELHLYNYVMLHVYDSWGRKVFSSKKYDNKLNGRDYPDGTYYYRLIAEVKDGGRIIKKDDIIEIIRE